MTLYLCIFDDDEEKAGLLVGHYSDFDYFREAISSCVDAERYPALLEHSDCDGCWEVEELETLRGELLSLLETLAGEAPVNPIGAFEHTAEERVGAKNMLESFHSVDGRPLVSAMLGLCDTAIALQRPILFQ